MSLVFSALLERALQDWPTEIYFGDLLKSDESSTRYTIKGLGETADNIADDYIGKADEVIMRNLHDAIYSVLHQTAAHVIWISMSQVRPDQIRASFERRLNNARMPELDYSEEDFQLVDAYFGANDNSNIGEKQQGSEGQSF